MLYPDLPASGKNVGMIMTENYRAALSQDVYTMKAGPQTYQPRFTSHGYQHSKSPASISRFRSPRSGSS
jgi:alpha-L-rhamnosidase